MECVNTKIGFLQNLVTVLERKKEAAPAENKVIYHCDFARVYVRRDELPEEEVK